MSNKWRPIESAPTNQRILVQKDRDDTPDEIAMAWLDRIDGQFWYSPQGGVMPWKPTHWMPVPDGPPALTNELDEIAIEAIDALRFYADPATYHAIGFFPDPPCGEFMEDFDEVDGDMRPGKRAREALEAIARLLIPEDVKLVEDVDRYFEAQEDET